ncbi:MAG TPA: toll/interleukin-1 receptor domain-containing protein [Thermoanaerobaculia bacterium]|nr:toll/interleukin-1 receptor domain-containing protein [Thermoanaerobaculia bacterium]
MVFLSYNSKDREKVREVKAELEARGVSTFLDSEHIDRGTDSRRALEEALLSCRGVAVFIGSELGSWQEREISVAWTRHIEEEQAGRVFPVVPVLLPGGSPPRGFLGTNSRVDLRRNWPDRRELDALARAFRDSLVPLPFSLELSPAGFSSPVGATMVLDSSTPSQFLPTGGDLADQALLVPDLASWLGSGPSRFAPAPEPASDVLVTIDALTDVVRKYAGTEKQNLNEVLGTVWRRGRKHSQSGPMTEVVWFTPADGSAMRRGESWTFKRGALGQGSDGRRYMVWMTADEDFYMHALEGNVTYEADFWGTR